MDYPSDGFSRYGSSDEIPVSINLMSFSCDQPITRIGSRRKTDMSQYSNSLLLLC